MYCTNCGKEIKSDGKFCPYCGTKQNFEGDSFAGSTDFFQSSDRENFSENAPSTNFSQNASERTESTPPTGTPYVAEDKKSGGFAFLSFLFPIVGLILYLVWKEQYPLKASSCGKGAIIGVIGSIVWLFFIAGLSSCSMSGYPYYALNPYQLF